jgi:hypothetical protein
MPGMGILDSLGKVVRGGGKGLSHLGTNKGSLLAIGAVMGTAGFASKVGPAARDATLEVGLGDENADRYFTGTKMSARTLMGAGIGGSLGEAMQMTSPGDYMKTNPVIPGAPGAPIGGAFAGGMLGAAAGGILGARKGIKTGVVGALLGAAAGAPLGAAGASGLGGEAIAGAGLGGLTGGVGGAFLGVKSGGSTFGRVAKGVVGGVMGAGIGATIGGAVPLASAGIATKGYMNDNADFFASSPYSRKGTQQIMNDLGASGNIVLGMHNSRRGY